MIIETHTPEQVVQEAKRDLPAMWNKMKEPIARLQRRMRVDKSLRMEPQLVAYRSPQGNNWLVAMMPTKKVLNVVPFVWYRGRDTCYRAARIMEGGTSYHISHHVLEQYNERFNSTVDGFTRLKEFVRENMAFGAEYGLNCNAVRVGVTHGYIIGTWVVPHDVAQLITFVDHGKLFKEQLEQMDRLDAQREEMLRKARVPGEPNNPWDLPNKAA